MDFFCINFYKLVSLTKVQKKRVLCNDACATNGNICDKFLRNDEAYHDKINENKLDSCPLKINCEKGKK